MLYELIAVVRPGALNEVKDIAKTTGSIVLARHGVVRGITNWGTFMLPSPVRLHGVKHYNGHYFIMRFDSSAQTQHIVRKTLSLDPRMLRFGVVRMGQTLEDIKDIGGRADWGASDEQS